MQLCTGEMRSLVKERKAWIVRELIEILSFLFPFVCGRFVEQNVLMKK